MRADPSSAIATPRRRGVIACHAPAMAALLDRRGALVAFLALGFMRQLLRLVPTLAIGLAVDRVASARAGATLVAIVSLLAVVALIEAAFGREQKRLRTVLKLHLSATRRESGRRARARDAASLELVAAVATVPPAILAMLAALALASPGLAGLAAILLALHAAGTIVTGLALRRAAQSLADADRVCERWAGETSSIAGIFRPGARTRQRRLDARRSDAQVRLERGREAHETSTALLSRLGFAAMLGLACLEAMAAMITPGALIAIMLVLRQLQALAESGGTAWLRAVETAIDPAGTTSGHAAATTRVPPLDLVPGELVVIVGATGAGKSRLLDALAARARETGDGAGIAQVEQEPRACSLPVLEMLRLAAPNADAAALDAVLAISGLKPRLRDAAGKDQTGADPSGDTLSAGQRGLLALAAALATGPRLLLIDALPDRLDATLRRTLLASLRDWVAGERTLVVVTASESWIAASDRIVLVERGRVRADLRRPLAIARAA